MESLSGLIDKKIGSVVTDKDILTLGHRARIQSIAGDCAGNLVEWFDFFTYAYTSIYFAGAFFPSGEKLMPDLRLKGFLDGSGEMK